jgi:pyroglutamyl-peptidase
MSNAPRAVLITGFGPFPGMPDNISAIIATEVGAEARRQFTWSRVITAALPTEWEVAPEMIADLICDHRPALALHFGVSAQARGFVIETIARNEAYRLDAAGQFPLMPEIEPFGPDEMATQLPAGRINARLQRIGLPTRLSRDAGTYLCNAVFYRSVLTQRELGGGGRSGFIHLPAAIKKKSAARNPLAGNLDLESTKRGALEIIAACLNR